MHINLLVLIVISSFSIAAKAKKQHKAHSHSQVQVNIAMEGKTGKITFESPSESIYGFEHEAKSDADKKKVEAAVSNFKQNSQQLFLFAPELGCKVTAGDINPRFVEKGETAHSEVRAEFSVTCDKPVAGSKLKFGLTQLFPKIKKIQTQVLSGEKQSGANITNETGSVEL